MSDITPLDSHNQKLLENVHPADWQNPTPADHYTLVVIGAGTAGLVTASVAAGLGAKVALIERELMGGDCLNVGCVPSKALISSARRIKDIENSSDYGITVDGQPKADFPAIMERMRQLRASISPVDSAERYKDLGIDVYYGEAKFVERDQIEVGQDILTFAKAVICTGARPAVPDVPGLKESDFLTNETIFNLTELPESLAVIGGGPIGCELAQTFAAFGSAVTLIESGDQILSHDDQDAAAVVREQLESDGVRIICGGKELTVGPGKHLKIDSGVCQLDQTFSHILVAAGRQPNVESLNLKAAEIEFSDRGVEVTDELQTTNENVFAAGDVASKFKFTHAADFMARAVIQNALFFGSKKVSDLVIPWCTYTTPELAHVGVTPDGTGTEAFTQRFEHIDRAILEGETEGFVRVHVEKGGDRILGATIVARNAGNMISQLSQAITHGIGLSDLAKVISPYPTQAEAIRKLGDTYNKQKFEGSLAKKLAKKLTEFRT